MTATTTQQSTLQPRLIVADAGRAIAFYVEAFGAEEVSRYEGDDGKIVHAELRFGQVSFTLKDEEPGTPDVGPSDLAGSPVILELTVADADAVGTAMEKAGATVIYPIDDHPYGRVGRLRDPFGHVWMISQN
ncbi:VOC family protein [Tenggerimyces flavus]|uniref:VOC family protein n=1 Tax=Tenggerimyces flavus TaxID=1708749 RepID=A0ABV7YFR2_9ACTN|nr:VOC family protein [Tenggerimyces flavus]MBM7786844.1 putative glyoxalase superfamily protein PhnB [Tenggerimyces flavus]